MSARIYRTSSEEETIELGRKLASELKRPCLILLIGNLGAGKTTLTKGIVSGLGVAPVEEVSSPTYTVIHEYGSDVYHIDLYRLDKPEQVASLGLDEMFDRGAVMLIEWGEAYRDVLPTTETIDIRIAVEGEERIISVHLR
ncbi:MAG TPA: tRNA (adenosine(37)-N6)-threonylcarbamoyltransferase complex ATPase subunit type 1 TsaE [Bryobacteraceae bacterium]|nr:tRNA (adenosine(37)-N6)-threonylcarbamoyltransferase complex ATPase subunit type 1 TsaE [Bryobacteraceae bacterium]